MIRQRNPFPQGCGYFTDSRGKRRLRFRLKGKKTVYPKSAPGTPEFLAEWNAFMEGAEAGRVGASRTKPGTINALVVRFYESSEWKGLAESTKGTYRGIIERFRAEHGDKRVAKLEREHVKKMVDKRAETPSAANNFLRIVGLLMRFAIDEKLRTDDPTRGVKPVRITGDGFHTWTEEEIAQFEAKHPIGSRPRLALGLLLYTGQRRSDVVRMGRQHVRNGWIHVKQQKTKTELDIPILPELQAILAASGSEHLTFLTTGQGKPYTPAGFGNWFREQCDEAELPQCSAHGLRKAAARRLAESGKSAPEICAITGHKNLREVQTYIQAAEQRRMAANAFGVVVSMDREQRTANGSDQLATSPSKSLPGKDNS